MRRYIIRMEEGEAFNAASKARKDAEIIAARLGYEPFVFRGGRTADRALSGAVRLALQGIRNGKSLLKKAEPGSLILVQYPFFPVKSAVLFPWIKWAAKRKNLRFIALVHDLDSLRGLHGRAAEYSDRKILPLFDAVICHNGRMKEYLAGQGVEKEKLIPLGIFDYLVKESPHRQQVKTETVSETAEESCLSGREETVELDGNTVRRNVGCQDVYIDDPHRGVVIAGNLSPDKCGYVQKLVEKAEEDSLPLHLYGKGLEEAELPPQVHFHGAFPPDVLPAKLQGSLGLVWDGASLVACEGRQGEYLRYNNPHKLSLYMAAGLPVILWKQAALADFVQRSGVGLLTDNLQDLERLIRNVSQAEYEQMRRQAESTGAAVRDGAFLTKALRQAENKVLGY